jgi:ActR/RegA family two-component response regulator
MLATKDDPNGLPTGARRRVLVVVDDRDFADSLDTLLGLEGYETSVAYSAQGALATIDDFDAQVAILDYRLGQKTGVELAEALKRRRPGIVCILATAFADLDTAVEALRQGIDDYFRKPLHAEELLLTLDRCFDKVRLEEEKRAAEEALREARRLEVLGRMAGGVAHHFNNLLMVIGGNMELLSDRLGDDPQSAQLVETVARAVDRAGDITQGLIAFTHDQHISSEPADLAALMLETGASLPDEAVGDLQVQWHTGLDLKPVRIDRDAFMKALECLIRNAAEAMPDGGRLVVKASNQDWTSDGPPGDERVPPGPLRLGRGRRRGCRDDQTGGRKGLRAVLHQQGPGRTHGPRPLLRPRLRTPVGRSRHPRQPGRPGNHRAPLPAGRGRR